MNAVAPSRDLPLVQVEGVCQSYDKGPAGPLTVLDNVALTLNAGEIVGLLGRSGSGKSTLLRAIAGLLQPTSGHIAFKGAPVAGVCPGVAVVFQTFALFPWLTVLGNVELGLEARGVAAAERRQRALAAIDLIGLDGYESAYPKLGRHAATRRVGACPRRAPATATDGRTVFSAGRADGRDIAHRPARSMDRRPYADRGDSHGHAQYRGSGLDVRPRPDLWLEPRPGDRRDQGKATAAAKPSRSGLPCHSR